MKPQDSRRYPAFFRFHAAWFALPVALAMLAVAVIVLLDVARTPSAASVLSRTSAAVLVPLTLQSGDVIGTVPASADDNLEVAHVASF